MYKAPYMSDPHNTAMKLAYNLAHEPEAFFMFNMILICRTYNRKVRDP